jgi:hypothetical protein
MEPNAEVGWLNSSDRVGVFVSSCLFFFDETDIHWCPDTGRTYQLPKQQLKVDSPSQGEAA